jgi:hypothetical protein
MKKNNGFRFDEGSRIIDPHNDITPGMFMCYDGGRSHLSRLAISVTHGVSTWSTKVKTEITWLCIDNKIIKSLHNENDLIYVSTGAGVFHCLRHN